MTQEEMADAMHVSRQTYVRWEAGHVEPSLQNLRRIADYFDVTVDQLLQDNEIENIGRLKVPPKGRYFYGLVTIDDEMKITLPKGACRQFELRARDKLLLLGSDGGGLYMVPPEYLVKRYQQMLSKIEQE